jgi:plastocyanin
LMSHGDGHLMDMDGGMIMGQNTEVLPSGCDKISEDIHIEVHAGRKYSKEYPGTVFGFNSHEWKVKPCSRLTVTFVNEDNVRHQWMMHGLPKFIYDKGMFHLEISGPAKITGTLILPAEDKTYLVHCDIAQHMEKGMKGQLIVGKGSGTFPSIPGITDLAVPDDYSVSKAPNGDIALKDQKGLPAEDKAKALATAAKVNGDNTTANSDSSSMAVLFGLLLGVVLAPFALKALASKYDSAQLTLVLDKISVILFEVLRSLVELLASLFLNLNKKFKLLEKK